MHILSLLNENVQDQHAIERASTGIVQWLNTKHPTELFGQYSLKNVPNGTLGKLRPALMGCDLEVQFSPNGTYGGRYWPSMEILTINLPSDPTTMTADGWKEVHSTLVHEIRHRIDHYLSNKGRQRKSNTAWMDGNKPYLELQHEINARFAQTMAHLNRAFANKPDMTLPEYIKRFEGIAAEYRLIDIFNDPENKSEFYKLAKTLKGSTEIFGRDTPGLYNTPRAAESNLVSGPVNNPVYRQLLKRVVKQYENSTSK